MRKILSFLIISLFLVPSSTIAQIIETHEFGSTSTQWYIYSSGKTWDFIVENNMSLQTIDVKSVLAVNGSGTFHIEVYIKGDMVANWDQYVNSTTYSAYYHSKQVNMVLYEGDEIQYKIYGGSFSTPVGGIMGINYVKLTGAGGTNDITFSPLPDMIVGKSHFGYTTDGSSIYLLGGFNSDNPGAGTSSEVYDISSNSWNSFVDGLLKRMQGSAEYLSATGEVYVFNGNTYSAGTYTDTVEIIDVGSGSIGYRDSNPFPVKIGGSASWNNKIYVFGGGGAFDGYSNRLYEYDPMTDIWLRLADMPEAKQTCGVVIDGILYVIGGNIGVPGGSNRIDAYNIENASWSSLGTMPVGFYDHAVARQGKNIWIVGSEENFFFLAVYNTETNEFQQLFSNMKKRRNCGATVVDNKLFVYGGRFNLNSIEVADISEYSFGLGEYQDSDTFYSRCYPNPFSSITTIEFTITENSRTVVLVYNQVGAIVEILLDEKLQEGKYEVNFDGSGLPGGIYYYIIQSGIYTGTGKLLLHK